MNTNKKAPDVMPFETQTIKPKEKWFDPIGIRYFLNATDKNITLGFSHDIRAVEMIAIIDSSKEKEKNPELEALEGEIVEEDI